MPISKAPVKIGAAIPSRRLPLPSIAQIAAQATAAYEAAFAPVLERGPNDGASAVRSMIAYMHGRTV